MNLSSKFTDKQNKSKFNRLQAEQKSYQAVKWARIRNHTYMLILLPLLLPIHLGLLIFFAISKEGSYKSIYTYLKSYFYLYFLFGGIQKLLTFPPPTQEPTKPTLFFTTRNHDLISCFLSTLFSYPVSIPVSSHLRKFPIHFFFPFVRMHSLITTLGYDDKPIRDSLPAIHQSLKQGKPTVVFINPKIINPMFNETLPMYNEIIELMDTSINCYFLACKGIEAIKAGTIFYPTFVSIHCVSKENLFEDVDKTHFPEQEKCLRIMKFFDFQKMDII
ncbi:hypothetical protein CL657_02410 [bacterium]|nr:hypothetical protein [bacterium]